jgi:hypothetical protein
MQGCPAYLKRLDIQDDSVVKNAATILIEIFFVLRQVFCFSPSQRKTKYFSLCVLGASAVFSCGNSIPVASVTDNEKIKEAFWQAFI